MSHINLPKKTLTGINNTRKRALHPIAWKRTVSKTKRNRGEEHVSLRGKEVQANVFEAQGKVCINRCQLAACSMDDRDKAVVHAKFWELGSYDLQRTHLMSLMEPFKAGQRNLVRYHVLWNKERNPVCQKTFMHVYGVTKPMIRLIISKIEHGAIAITDGRGLHDNRANRTDDEVKKLMLDHIDAYPKYDTHYSRKTQGEKYLSPDLNVTILFRQFVERHPDIPNCGGKDWLFRKIFRETGITIGTPKSDTCKTCDELFIKIKYPANPAEKDQSEANLMSHQVHSDRAYACMYEDINRSKNENSFVVVCCDLQQVLFSPTLTHSDMFYIRQFSSYNFCVYNGNFDKGYMYTWHEGEGNRGVDEIASAILLYVKENYRPLEIGQKRSFVIWSDRCRGQNNNYQLICLLLYLVKEKYFTSVLQKFLCSGHSFLPCDRLFAQIERKKHVSVAYVPSDWNEIILASQPNNPFEVRHLDQEHIFQVKDFLDLQFFQRPNTLKVSEIQMMEIDATDPRLILTRKDFNLGVWSRHIIPAPNQVGICYALRQPLDLNAANIVLRKKYPGPLEINQAKQKDIEKMLPFLPPQYRLFYRNFIN